MALFVQLRLLRWSIGGHQPSRPGRAESGRCPAATDEGLRLPRPFHPRCYDTRSPIKMNRSGRLPQNPPRPAATARPPVAQAICSVAGVIIAAPGRVGRWSRPGRPGQARASTTGWARARSSSAVTRPGWSPTALSQLPRPGCVVDQDLLSRAADDDAQRSRSASESGTERAIGVEIEQEAVEVESVAPPLLGATGRSAVLDGMQLHGYAGGGGQRTGSWRECSGRLCRVPPPNYPPRRSCHATIECRAEPLEKFHGCLSCWQTCAVTLLRSTHSDPNGLSLDSVTWLAELHHHRNWKTAHELPRAIAKWIKSFGVAIDAQWSVRSPVKPCASDKKVSSPPAKSRPFRAAGSSIACRNYRSGTRRRSRRPGGP